MRPEFFTNMPTTITDLINNISTIKVEDIVREVMADNADLLSEKQRKQMLAGQDSTGGKIGKYASKSYRKKKFEMNPLAGYGNVDLRLTGAFQKGIKPYFFSTEFFFKSTDSKNEILTKRYGEDIFGLTDKNTADFSNVTLAPLATEEIIKRIHGM